MKVATTSQDVSCDAVDETGAHAVEDASAGDRAVQAVEQAVNVPSWDQAANGPADMENNERGPAQVEQGQKSKLLIID